MPKEIMGSSANVIFQSDFRPILWLDKIEIPVMVMHGWADRIVLPYHACVIHGTLRCRKELVMIPDAPHTLGLCEGREAVFANIVRWFRETLSR